MKKVIILEPNNKYHEELCEGKLLPNVKDLSLPRPYFYNVISSNATLCKLIGLSENSEIHAIRCEKFCMICARPKWTIESICEFESIFKTKKNIKAIFLNKSHEIYGNALIYNDTCDFTEADLLDVIVKSYSINELDILMSSIAIYLYTENKIPIDLNEYFMSIYPMLSGKQTETIIKEINNLAKGIMTIGDLKNLLNKFITVQTRFKLSNGIIKEYISRIESSKMVYDTTRKINTVLSNIKSFVIDMNNKPQGISAKTSEGREKIMRNYLQKFVDDKMVTLEFIYLHLGRAMMQKYVLENQSFYMLNPMHPYKPGEMFIFTLETERRDDGDAEYLYKQNLTKFLPIDYDQNVADYIKSLKSAGRFKEGIKYY